jgi:hypothetical protein
MPLHLAQRTCHRVLHYSLWLILPLLAFAVSASPLSCVVPPADPHSSCLHGHALPCSGHGACTEGVCVCDGDWIGKNCDSNAVTTTLFMESPPSLHESCVSNTWRTQASAAFIAEIEQLHDASQCHPSTALLHMNLETRQGLGAMMLFAVGALTMSMQRNMAAVCVGQFFYDSFGACKQQPEFEPPLLCLFEPVWGCTSSAFIAAANGSGAGGRVEAAAPVLELTAFDSSAYEVSVPSCYSPLLIPPYSQVVYRHKTLGYFWQQALLLSYISLTPASKHIWHSSHSLLLHPSATSCALAQLCAANSLLSK